MEVSVTVDGIPVTAEEGTSVLKAALQAGIYIPHICSHPDLESIGACKLCVVEVAGQEGVVTSCTLPVQEGMEVTTKSENLEHIRRVVMEFMLAGHPHDCTSCKMYLKCELQAMMQYTNSVHGRMREVTKTTTKINTNNPLIIREMERCIQCERCVRVCRDVRGVGILKLNKAEGNAEIYVGTEEDRALAEANCRFCSACVEVCPTGALQDAEGVFDKTLPGRTGLVPCRAECPAHTDIAEYLRLTAAGRAEEASAVIHEKLPFPKALGRVCTRRCEAACKRNGLNDPLSIRNIKRYAVNAAKEETWKTNVRQNPDTGKKVAVVGGGPAGMTAALYLRKQGHDVTVYEQHASAGGYLQYGIPAYRLPREEVQAEIRDILHSGVKLRTGVRIECLDELKASCDAVVLAMGTPVGKQAPLPGAEKGHTITAAEFLYQAAEGADSADCAGKKVIVLGGGNVAFDAARTAVRLGAEVSMFCLESREEMLADEEEILQGTEEGIVLHNSTVNLELAGTPEALEGLRYAEISGFSFEPEGLRVEQIPGTEALEPGDLVIFAMGQKTDIPEGFGVELNAYGYPILREGTHQTMQEQVFAAGDVVTGTRSVIEAIAGAREAASECDRYLGGNGDIEEVLYQREPHNPEIGREEGFAFRKREHPDAVACGDRLNSGETERAFTDSQAVCEAERCLQCDLRCDLHPVKLWTEYQKGGNRRG
ncbi:NADPH-dependent glutamate synthase beta chain [Clostridium sp. SY8519]|uniref:FAD-dependent oxidoreductase n=1 Tax=Clostridium sp. (strain SY8519) TaxID=1042156 RepID=UPI0002171EFF|nr:FAD-dependent oxidoreductase [Clostridium sp. SY8519]BAK46667.1 NADPH-dependent glutamate synthase beta chain [Clostridium sp. SY8519]